MSVSSYSAWSTAILFFVLLSIPACLLILKRFPGLGRGGAKTMRVVESMPIGPRERMLVIHTGGQYFLVGSTSQQINLLQSLPDYVESATTDGGFSTVLAEVKRHGQ